MSEAKYEEKFIVINKKHIEEFKKAWLRDYGDFNNGQCNITNGVFGSIEIFTEMYEKYCKKSLDQKYIVCNQDEPYAGSVLKIILDGESKKL